MNWEVESALNRKVDSWEFNSLQQSHDSLKREKEQLEREVQELNNRVSNYYYSMERITQAMLESKVFDENLIYDIRQYL